MNTLYLQAVFNKQPTVRLSMRISASVSTLPYRELPEIIPQMEDAGVDAWHLDSIEKREIFNLAAILGQISTKPRDLHLITSDPVKYWNEVRKTGIEAISVQLEQLHSPMYIPRDLLGKVGIAVLANTQPEAFQPYAGEAAWILIMTTTPGYSGGTFQPSHFEKIVRYRLAYPDKPIYVDGGVIPEIAAVLKLLGIEQVVSGSFLLSGAGVRERVKSLKEAKIDEGKVKDIMVRRSHWPDDFKKYIGGVDLAAGKEQFQWFINKRGELSRINKVLSGSLPLMIHEDLALPLLVKVLEKYTEEIPVAAVVNDLFQFNGLLTLSIPHSKQ